MKQKRWWKARNIFYHSLFRWIGRKRGEFTVTLAAIAIIDVLWGDAYPLDLLEIKPSVLFLLCWALLLGGVMARIWAAGNLRKNEEITMTGIYAMVRHPLYLGTLLIYLSFLLAVGNIFLGLVLYALIILIVYYPRILHEEENLARSFPEEFSKYVNIPRLLPNPFLLPRAIRSDRFSLRMAYKNLGLRSLWALILVPLILKLLIKIKGGN